MSKASNILQLGLRRGWIEFKIFTKDPQAIIWMAIIYGIFLVVLWFQRNTQIEGVSLALLTLPSLLGMQIASSGFSDVSSQLAYDREDGTLLRAKAIPRGMVAYFISRVFSTLLSTLLSVVLLLIASVFIVPGILSNIDLVGAVMLFGLMILGLLATAPFGAIIGSVVKTASGGWGLTILPFGLITAISGIFYPITALAGWLQIVAQVFPVYWLGLGVRSVFLPDAAAALELTGSWRMPETFAILGAWAIVGILVVPRVLRRMARRTSGSEMQAARERTIQRGY